jgi:hypothetical protein
LDAIVEQTFNRKARRLWKAVGGGDQTARDLVNSLYGATFKRKGRATSLSILICFRSQPTQKIPRLTVNTAFAANGKATQGRKDTSKQPCVSRADLESMLLPWTPKIFLQQYRPVADAGVAGLSVRNWSKFRHQ